MTQIVKVEVGHASSDAKMFKRQSHGIAGHGECPIRLWILGAQLMQGFDSAT